MEPAGIGPPRTGLRSTLEVRPVDLELESNPVGESVVLTVGGEVDLNTAPQLKERINALLAQGHTRVVVDLQRVSFMDSTGLSALVSGLMRTGEGDGGRMAVVCTTPHILRLLALTGLDQVLKVYSSVEEAVA